MKNLILLFLFISSFSFAQTGINFQGAATDADGVKLVNQNISLKTSILMGGVDGTTTYSETHSTTTDQFGLFNVVIGQGVSISGDFESISWGSGDHFLKVELDATGGTNYSLVSTTQMMSVPYALYAKNAGLDSTAVADMLTSMNISGNSGGCNYSFPEGIGQMITWDLFQNDYIVPTGKNLYITNIYTQNAYYFEIDGKRLFGYENYAGNDGAMLTLPICVKAGQTISYFHYSSWNDPSVLPNFHGTLVDATVEPITYNFDNAGSGFENYTVPNGKKLIITQLWIYDSGDYLTIDGNIFGNERFNTNLSAGGKQLNIPLIINSGSILFLDDNLAGFNGYLVDEDYFESPSSSSVSNLGVSSTMDLSVSQYGDTLYGLGNDFLVIPGLSQSNLHMQFNEYGSVTDIDDNTYKTLVYGNDEWMIENLRTHIGDYIQGTSAGLTPGGPSSDLLPYNDSIGNFYSYSTLQSDICPDGWHISTIEDWLNLHIEIFGTEMNPNGYTSYQNGYEVNNYRILWSTLLNGTNQSHFNLFETGHYTGTSSYQNWGQASCHFITSTPDGSNSLRRVNIIISNDYNDFELDVGGFGNSGYNQVRCVKD